MISLLNCQRKISEKIVVTKLFYLKDSTDMLHSEEMRNRKNRFAINAVMNLIHNAQLAKNFDNVLSCLFMNMKKAYDYVSINQLIKILRTLQISRELIQ